MIYSIPTKYSLQFNDIYLDWCTLFYCSQVDIRTGSKGVKPAARQEQGDSWVWGRKGVCSSSLWWVHFSFASFPILYIAWMRLFNHLRDVAEYYLLIMNFQNLMALFLYSVYFNRHIFNNSVKFSLNIKIRMRLETTM